MIGTHDPPELSHRDHWYANVGAGWPVQTPAEAVSSCPSVAVPETDGGVVFAGAVAAGCTTEVAEDETGPAEPALFDPVTPTPSVDPTSAPTTVYVEPVAPPIGTHEAPELSHRDH